MEGRLFLGPKVVRVRRYVAVCGRYKTYKQTFGLSMGNKLSPLLANVFMSDFENEYQTEKLFPRVWKRYVDDIFAAVKERSLDKNP